MESEIKGILNEAIKSKVFSGASISVVDDHGETRAMDAGTTRYESNVPFTNTSLVDIASITKLLTSLALHRYAQELPERLAFLQRPIKEFLPDLQLDAQSQDTTLADVLEMRLNWQTGASLSDIARNIFAQTPDHLKRIQHLREFLMHASVSKLPDTTCNYQDASYIALGWVLEQLYPGMTYDDIVAQTVLEPLGMSDTTTQPDISRCVPSGYEDGAYLQGIQHDPKARLVHGHAGFFSTGSDLTQLAYMLQRKGKLPESSGDFLSSESFDSLTHPRSLDARRGWWCRGIRRYQGPDQPPHGTNDLWFGPHADNDTLGVSGFTAQSISVYGERTSVIMLTNYHVPADLDGYTGDKGFPGEIQSVRMRVLEAVSR